MAIQANYTRNSGHHRATAAHWPAVLYGLIALAGCLFAFVGLSSNSFWADELYTMQVVNHNGGLAEVFRRVLADVHPPLYDVLLYGWIQVAGHSEWAVRLPSALFGVAAILMFAFGTRRRLSPTTIAFACAVATTSMFWFVQSQNMRDYALSMLLSSALLVAAIRLHEHTHRDNGFPLGAWLWLTVLGIAGSQTHPYMLLTVGMAFVFLLLTARTWSMRIALAASGLLVLGLYVGLMWLMTHTDQKHGFAGTWFSNKPKFLASQLRRVVFNLLNRQAALVVVAMLLALWFRRRSHAEQPIDDSREKSIRWTTGLCWFVFIGVLVSGIAISILFAPSFSYRNVLTCTPFAWFLVGRLYDRAGPRTDTRLGAVLAAIAVLLVGSQLIVLMRGRLLPTNEPWRASAAYAQGLPGCGDTTLPLVVMPDTYGSGMTPAVHDMIERNYFGYYLPSSYRTHAYLSEELVQHFASSLPASDTAASSCPLIAWGVHDFGSEDLALALGEQLASTPGLTTHSILVQEFLSYQLRWLSWKAEPGGFVFLLATPETLQTPATLTAGTDIDRKRSLGDLLQITDVTPTQNKGSTASVYAIKRWRAGKMIGETTISPRQPSTSSR